MIDFPASPTVGQFFNSGTGTIYMWDGVAWNIAGSTLLTADRQNAIVNPAMLISQEWGQTLVTALGAFPVDQWATSVFNGSTSVGAGQQVTAYTPGKSHARLRKTITTAVASPGANAFSCILQVLEGLSVSRFAFGTPDAQQLVFRFGFKGPAGVYSAVVRNTALDRSFIKNFTISAAQANTDTLQVITVPGDTTGTWGTGNAGALSVGIFDAVGATYQGVEGWQAGDKRGTAANSNLMASTANVVELFDTGLYADPEMTGAPPPFEVPNYADELLRCQRYFERGTGLSIYGYNLTGGAITAPYPFKTTKRVAPTMGNLGWTGAVNATGQAFTASTPEGVSVSINAAATGSVGFSGITFNVSARM